MDLEWHALVGIYSCKGLPSLSHKGSIDLGFQRWRVLRFSDSNGSSCYAEHRNHKDAITFTA